MGEVGSGLPIFVLYAVVCTQVRLFPEGVEKPVSCRYSIITYTSDIRGAGAAACTCMLGPCSVFIACAVPAMSHTMVSAACGHTQSAPDCDGLPALMV